MIDSLTVADNSIMVAVEETIIDLTLFVVNLYNSAYSSFAICKNEKYCETLNGWMISDNFKI